MFKKSPTALIEGDIATLLKREASLQTRLTAASAASLVAVGERRRLLVDSDAPQAEELAAHDRKCRDTADAETAAEDALQEVRSRIAGAQDRLARLQTAEARDRAASAVEGSAKTADAALDRALKAARELDAARRDLAEAILPSATACYAPSTLTGDTPSVLTRSWFDYRGELHDDDLTPDEVALRMVGHAVSAVLPGYGIATTVSVKVLNAAGRPTPVLAPAPDATTLQSLLTGPMRKHAAALRSGTVEVAP